MAECVFIASNMFPLCIRDGIFGMRPAYPKAVLVVHSSSGSSSRNESAVWKLQAMGQGDIGRQPFYGQATLSGTLGTISLLVPESMPSPRG